MAKDPGFLFYPGDYLRDTQCLSEKAQVAYDRIMCEHMRNICEDVNNIAVTKDRIDFFIKRLSDDEKSEIYHVLKQIPSGFQIEWVAISMSKRKSYTNSRAKNRAGKNNKNLSFSYDSHMENEDEINKLNNGKTRKHVVDFKARPEELLVNRLAESTAKAKRGREKNN